MSDGAGNSIRYTLDALGNRTAESAYDSGNTLSRTQGRVYNALGELYQVIGAAGTAAVTTTLGYDNNANLTSSNAPLSRNTSNQYDVLNRLTQITDAASGVTQLSYDANDGLVSVTDPRNLTTSYDHNGFGNLTQRASPDTGTTTNTYDAAGNLQTATDARGAVVTYSHDALNRVISANYQNGGAIDQTIAYSFDSGTNGKGRLTGASDANHSLSWTYDPLGRVMGKVQTVGGVTKSVGYTYVNANLTSLTTPSGQTVTYSYANHQITGITVNSTAVLTGATYEPFGPVRGWTWGNGTTEIRLHNTDGNPSIISGVESVSLGYDNAFRITSATNSSNSTLSWSYGYDNLDRLTSASETGTTLGWQYDASGNRLQQTGAAASSALSTSGQSFTFNARGRMNSATAAGATTIYIYNALGQLIEKNVGGVVTLIVYDEAGHLMGEYSATGTLVQETIWLGDIPVATIRPNGGSVAIDYVHADLLGTPRMVTRPADNAVLWRWDTDPYGTAAPNQNPQSLGTFIYNLRFPGQYYQSESGLNYNYYRDYDAASGRYRQSDLIGLRGGVNTYAYVNGNPISRLDRRGLFSDPMGDEARALAGLGSWIGDYLGDHPEFVAAVILGLFTEKPGTVDDVLALDRLLATEEAEGSIGAFSPINPGPLEEDVAKTFRSGTYTGSTLSEDTTLYRVIGDNGNPGGNFWSRTPPSGPLQSAIDSALDQSWGNTATTTITRTFPRGTQIFEGAAAPQGGLAGGGNQIYIPQPLP